MFREMEPISSGAFLDADTEVSAENDLMKKLETQEQTAKQIKKTENKTVYDKDGKQVSVTTIEKENQGNPQKSEIQYAYDSSGRLSEKIYFWGGDRKAVTSYMYDGDRLKTETRTVTFGGQPAPSFDTTTHYLRQGETYEHPTTKDILIVQDENGRELERQEFKGDDDNRRIIKEYDERGRETKRTSFFSNKKAYETLTVYHDNPDGSYTATMSDAKYDDSGMSRENETWLLVYNSDGNIVSKMNTEDPNRFELSSYNVAGKLVKRIARKNHSFQGRPSEHITTQFATNTYDERGNILTTEVGEVE